MLYPIVGCSLLVLWGFPSTGRVQAYYTKRTEAFSMRQPISHLAACGPSRLSAKQNLKRPRSMKIHQKPSKCCHSLVAQLAPKHVWSPASAPSTVTFSGSDQRSPRPSPQTRWDCETLKVARCKSSLTREDHGVVGG